jgi:hypothetical protein
MSNLVNTIKTTGELRRFLVATIEAIREGTIDVETASQISKMAAQVNESFYSEIKLARTKSEMRLRVDSFGELNI